MVDMIQTSRDYRTKLDKSMTAFSLFIHDLCLDARLEISFVRYNRSLDSIRTAMIIGKPAPFVHAFVDAIDEALHAHSPGQGLSALQRAWLAFCLTAILVTNSICWARFERTSLGTNSLAALSWMFRHAKIPWEDLLGTSVRVILRHYGITSGTLVIDDTDNKRSKLAQNLAHLYKLRDKDSGGYLWGQSLVFLLLVTPMQDFGVWGLHDEGGQSLVFLLLVTPTITIPVGFTFYRPLPSSVHGISRSGPSNSRASPRSSVLPNRLPIRRIPPNKHWPCGC
jgi:hypothetical protein